MALPEVFPDVQAFVLSALTVAFAQFVYATAGFGAGMVGLALLALVLPDLAPAVMIIGVLALLTEVWVVARSHREAAWPMLARLFPPTAIGMAAGVYLLATGDATWLKRVLGVVVAAMGIWMGRRTLLDRETSGARTKASPRWYLDAVAGFAAGVLGGLFGAAAPPLVAYFQHLGLAKASFRATLLAYFLVANVVRLASYGAAGLIGEPELAAALWLVPAAIAGTAIGFAAHRRASERQFRLVVCGTLALLGLILVASGGR